MSHLPTSSATDQQLVAQVLSGNTAAFGHIVRRTEGLVTQLVFKLIRQPADRPDIAQEVYLKVFKNLAGFKFQAKLSTWVYFGRLGCFHRGRRCQQQFTTCQSRVK